MEFLRNTIAVLVGLLISGLVISLGVHINPEWVVYDYFSPFQQWEKFLFSMKNKPGFHAYLLFLSGLSATIGGIATAIIVKHAKVAYALLIGFILLFLAMLDVIIYPYHPIFYKILIFLTFFPFSWIGGKTVEILYKKRRTG